MDIDCKAIVRGLIERLDQRTKVNPLSPGELAMLAQKIADLIEVYRTLPYGKEQNDEDPIM